MAGFMSDFELSPHNRRWPAGGWLRLLLCLAVLVVLPGCRGCRRSAEDREAEQKRQAAEKEKEKEKEKKKPDLEIGTLVSQPHKPGDPLDPFFLRRACPCKPGHWTATTLPARANNFDIVGDLEMTVVDAAQGSRRRGKPMELVATPYTSTGSRVIALPKGG